MRKKPPDSGALKTKRSIENMMSDRYSGMCSVVGSEVGEITYVRYSAESFLSRKDTALFDVSGIINLVYSSAHCGSELSGCIDNTVDGVGISCGSYSVHNNRTYRNLTFIRFSACFALNKC